MGTTGPLARPNRRMRSPSARDELNTTAACRIDAVISQKYARSLVVNHSGLVSNKTSCTKTAARPNRGVKLCVITTSARTRRAITGSSKIALDSLR